MAQRIPLSNSPRQVFSVRLGTRTYRFRVWWNKVAEAWYLDLATPDNTPLLSGIRLTAGRRLLQGYRVDFLGDLFVWGSGDPGRQSWTVDHHLTWIEPGE